MLQKIFEGTQQEYDQYRKKNKHPKTSKVVVYLDIKETTSRKNISPQTKVQHPQLKAFLTTVEETGGLSPSAVEEMKENSKKFREEFWLDK